MKYTMVRLFLIAACSCVVSASCNTASAGWGLLHGGGSSGGSSGGYGSYGAGYGSSGGVGYGSSGGVASYGSSGGYAATSYGSSGGSSGGPGPLRRFAAHIHDHMAAKHARRAAYAGSSGGGSSGYVSSYGSSGGSSGYSTSYGSSGGYGSSGYSTSYGSSGGSSGYSASYGSSGYSTSYGSSGGGYGSSGYSTSYGSSGASYGSAGSVMSYGSSGSTYSSGYLGVTNQSPAATADLASQDSDAIYLNVAVPATAKVYVNDMPTTSTGVSRQYVSRGLESGKSYKFELRAEVLGVDGKVAKETKLVTLNAGQKDTIRFASLESTRVQTAVTLNVPADAKVILAGNETSATGETRTYRTSQLLAGDRWDDYVVEVHHNGKVKRETLRLVAGDEVALTFNFEDDKSLVASR